MLEQAFAFFYKHCKVMQRWKGELSWLFVYPLIGIISLGIFASFLIEEGASIQSLHFVVIGVIAWNFFSISQRAVTYGLLFEVWDMCVRHLFVSPVKKRHFILGNMLFGFASGLISFILVAVVSYFIFNFNIFSVGYFLLIGMLIITLHSTAEGLLINSLIIKNGVEYMSLTWIVPGFIMIFSGVYYPVSALPGFLQPICYLLPTTYAIELMRSGLPAGGSSNLLNTSLSGIIMGIIFMAVSIMVYSKAIEKSKETGALSKIE